MMNPPIDQIVRERFIQEIGKNFSVIAPAGVGKTESIVRRVVAMASQDPARAIDILPRLVVVTYTNRAADEMKHRALNGILQNEKHHVLSAFSQAFFGTIHKFCFGLVRQHGHVLGLPSTLEQAPDDDSLWQEFIRQLPDLGDSLPDEVLRQCLRHVNALELIKAGQRVRLGTSPPPAPGFCPAVNYQRIFDFEPTARNRDNVAAEQERCREWINVYENTEDSLTVWKAEAGGGKFKNLCAEVFAPMKQWLGNCTAAVGCWVASEYQRYRLSRGMVTYDDQIELAYKLMTHPGPREALRQQGLRVILDEAQDTDPLQFRVLLELARPEQAEGDWVETGKDGPRPGHFSMVGDLQQSIYGGRADLHFYRKVHEALKADPEGDELTFQVTFRCDQEIVNRVNRLFPEILTGEDGQVNYVPLTARSNAGPGQVLRLELPAPENPPEKRLTEYMARTEARLLAEWIKKQGLEKLRAPCWSEVAILCPRKRWFEPLARQLRRLDIPVQIHSTKDLRGDSPAYAWLTALLVVMSDPRNSFEIAGVLREVFGLSDQQLADFSEGNGVLFQIEDTLSEESGPVAETLALLAETRKEILTMPLYDAVNRLVEATALRERLNILPDYPAGILLEELEGLILCAAQAESDGLSLAEWAEEMRTGFTTGQEDQAVDPNCLQLLTCQKAKGLQWHAVIIPSLCRDIKGKTNKYPMALYRRFGDPPVVAWDSSSIPPDLKEQRKQSSRQEMQRILYVAMTRARRTLVLVDSLAICEKAGKNSIYNLLSLGEEPNSSFFESLPAEPAAEPAAEETAPVPSEEKELAEVFPPFGEQERALCRANAERFVHRKLPSDLAHESSIEEPEKRKMGFEPEPDEEARMLQQQARDYGTWWHEMMQSLPWAQGKESWDAAFELKLTSCEQPGRAREEWELFKASEAAKVLTGDGRVVLPELPVLVAGDRECLEGFADLAMLDNENNQWTIIDWKTDRLDQGKIDVLIERYAPQLAAYREAVEKITSLPAEAWVYSTRLGEWGRV